MKAVSIPEIVSQLRQKRNGRTFIAEFINQCEFVDAIPLTKIEKAREELWEEVLKYSGSGDVMIQAYCDGLKDGLAILDKLIESED